MRKTKLLLSLVVVLTITYLSLEVFNQGSYLDYVRIPIIPLLTYTYYLKTKDRSSFFFLFLTAFSVAELICGLFVFFYESTGHVLLDDIQFYTGNICYILAYVFLIMEVLKNLNIKQILRKFPFTILILLALDTYSVILVSKVSIESGYFVHTAGMVIEVIYNTTIMLLLSVALINYLNRDSSKAINMLLAATCIVFSEVIQGAYIYITELNLLKILASIFMLGAFIFLYIQSKMSYGSDYHLKSVESEVNNV